MVYLWLLRWIEEIIKKYKDTLPQEFLSEVLQETMTNGRPRKCAEPFKFMEELGEEE